MAGLFWKMTGLSTIQPIDLILDKSVFTLEELLDEDQIIQECKTTNVRLVNFLKGKAQLQQMLQYIIEEPPEGADHRRAFKFPFISCQLITCEIESILKTLGDDEELLAQLFSFLDPHWKHGTLLAGYFSKVVICLLSREHAAIMRHLQAHENILKNIVDLIGITSIKEVLMRLVEAGDHIYAYHAEAMHWLGETTLLEMLVDKLSPQNSSEVHANAAEVLAGIGRTFPSELASKLASPRFVAKLFNHALEDRQSKSALIHSLSVCISLLPSVGISRTQDTLSVASPETVDGMLQNLGNLLDLLDVSQDTKKLPTTYGELRPPFGPHRLKIVEFIAVLLRTHSEAARQELLRLEALQKILSFFFNYPFNNMLHNHVEAIITSCMDNGALIDNLFQECDFLSRLLATDENPYAPDTRPESNASKKKPPLKVGNMGHLTRIANRLVQTGTTNLRIQSYLQSHPRWQQWQASVLQQRNMLENVYQWTCGRPSILRERPVESDDEESRERDYDVSAMASNLTREIFRYGMFDNEDAEEIPGTVARDEEDIFFDDEAAEVVISSICLSDEQDRFGDRAPPSWFAFEPENLEPSSADNNDDPSLLSSSFRDDEVVVGEDDAADGQFSRNGVVVTSSSAAGFPTDGLTENASYNLDWARYDIDLETIKREDFGENNPFIVNFDDQPQELSVATGPGDVTKPESFQGSGSSVEVHGESVIVGVEPEGAAKAMESALKEGIVGEAGPLKPMPVMNAEASQDPEKFGAPEYNDVNYWRSDYENTVAGVQ